MPDYFKWRIDSENYLLNKHAKADKLATKDFITIISKSLNDYEKYELPQLMNNQVSHCHVCANLPSLGSDAAKRLCQHLKEINKKLGAQSAQIDGSCVLQLHIKGFNDKRYYRCFGYVLSGIYNLIYLDPEHEVYPE
jgi:hypothetical protein